MRKLRRGLSVGEREVWLGKETVCYWGNTGPCVGVREVVEGKTVVQGMKRKEE